LKSWSNIFAEDRREEAFDDVDETENDDVILASA
jgi:hypothetical protein